MMQEAKVHYLFSRLYCGCLIKYSDQLIVKMYRISKQQYVSSKKKILLLWLVYMHNQKIYPNKLCYDFKR